MASPQLTPSAVPRAHRIEKRKKPLRRWDPTNVVQIYVGPEKEAGGGIDRLGRRDKPLNVHKEVACYYSPVFRAAFNSKFKEGTGQWYRLEDVGSRGDGVDVVKLMIHWMYNQDLDTSPPVDRKTKSATDQTLCELWVLADRLLISSLQNAIIRELDRLRKRFKATSTSCIPYVYEKTMSGSPLRKLFVDHCAWNVMHTRFKERPDHFPQEMLLDLAEKLTASFPGERKQELSTDREIEDFEIEEEED